MPALLGITNGVIKKVGACWCAVRFRLCLLKFSYKIFSVYRFLISIEISNGCLAPRAALPASFHSYFSYCHYLPVPSQLPVPISQKCWRFRLGSH